jgi:hypothetical protein
LQHGEALLRYQASILSSLPAVRRQILQDGDTSLPKPARFFPNIATAIGLLHLATEPAQCAVYSTQLSQSVGLSERVRCDARRNSCD